MAIGLAALGGAALSPLTGLGFGFGYGYGVRLGYHSFKPSKSSQVTGMRLSPNPLTAGTGMGLASAEEMTGKSIADSPIQGMTTEPTPVTNPNVGYWDKTPHVEAPDGRKITKAELKKYASTHKMDMRSITRAFIKRLYPFNQQTYKKGRPSR